MKQVASKWEALVRRTVVGLLVVAIGGAVAVATAGCGTSPRGSAAGAGDSSSTAVSVPASVDVSATLQAEAEAIVGHDLPDLDLRKLPPGAPGGEEPFATAVDPATRDTFTFSGKTGHVITYGCVAAYDTPAQVDRGSKYVEQAAAEVASRILAPSELKAMRLTSESHGSEYEVAYRQWEGDVPTFRELKLTMTPDGRLKHVWMLLDEVAAPAKPKITADEAIEIVRDRQGGSREATCTASLAIVRDNVAETQHLAWQVETVDGDIVNGPGSKVQATVDAITGEVLDWGVAEVMGTF